MIVVDGIQLSDKCSWITKRTHDQPKGRVLNGVFILVSSQNVSMQWIAWQRMVMSLNPLPQKFIFCENDSDDETLQLIKEWDFPHELMSFRAKTDRDDIYSAIAQNRQKLLERARELDPKFVVFLDDDVFPHNQDFLDLLVRDDLPIVGGKYIRAFQEGVFVASKWSVDAPVEDLPPAIGLEELVDDAKKNKTPYLMFSDCEDKLYKVAATSAGCMCIRGDVIKDERLNFYPRKQKMIDNMVSEDFAYCVDASRFGYETYLDGRVRLEHLLPGPNRLRPWSNTSNY